MSFDSQAFLIDDLALPWGLTLPEAAQRLRGREQPSPYGGDNLRVACRSVHGLAATEAYLRAPGRHKPVMQVSYELAASPASPPTCPHEAPWLEPLTALLGAPTTVQLDPQARGQASRVYCVARWQQPAVQVTLSVYGAVRTEPSGRVAAGLWVSWLDVVAAARPFYAAALTQAAILESTANQLVTSYFFRLQDRVYSSLTADPQVPPAQEATRRLARRALYQEGMYDTPGRLRAQLSEYEVLLWAVPGLPPGWALSTKHDTVVLGPGGAGAQLLTVHPARGGGNLCLTVGSLVLVDGYGTPALPALAEAIEQHTGRPVARGETLDC